MTVRAVNYHLGDSYCTLEVERGEGSHPTWVADKGRCNGRLGGPFQVSQSSVLNI